MMMSIDSKRHGTLPETAAALQEATCCRKSTFRASLAAGQRSIRTVTEVALAAFDRTEAASVQGCRSRLQLQRGRIDAVAQAGRAGAVIEDVAEMAVAFRAQHLGADHAVADVALLVDMAVHRGRGKARPAAAGIELGVGFEQRLAAAGADIGALALLMLVFAGERPLGRLLAQHRILHRRQFAAPFGLALLDLAGRRLGRRTWISFTVMDRFAPRMTADQLVTLALLTSVGFSM